MSIALAKHDYLEGSRDGYRNDLLHRHMKLREFHGYNDPDALYRVYDGINTTAASFVFGEDDGESNLMTYQKKWWMNVEYQVE